VVLGGEQVYVAVRLLVVARAAYFAPVVGKRCCIVGNYRAIRFDRVGPLSLLGSGQVVDWCVFGVEALSAPVC